MSDAGVVEEAPQTPTAMLRGDMVYRVVWLPGSDRLRGFCWCGADHVAEDPVTLWTWLLAHPDTHGRAGATVVAPPVDSLVLATASV